MDRLNALINYLKKRIVQQGDEFFVEQGSYVVLTEEEAKDRAEKRILKEAWTFHVDFLFRHLTIKDNEFNRELIKKIIQQGEQSNELILSLIKDRQEFIKDALKEKDRAHFIIYTTEKEAIEENYRIFKRSQEASIPVNRP